MVNQKFPSELQLNRTYSSDTEDPFLDLHFDIQDGFVSSKIYVDFDIVNCPFLDRYLARVHHISFTLTSLQLVLCRVAAVKRLPVHQP